MKKELIVSFSGGRTSAFMGKWLIDNCSHIFDLKFVFCNTGAEHQKTLEFVNKCDIEFGFNLVWLEAVVNPIKGKGGTYKIVNFETASRNNEPFEAVISKYGIPNKEYPHCTRELKLDPMNRWKKDNCNIDSDFAVGIRADEPKRIKYKKGVFYPLVDLIKVDKKMVLDWWKLQPFDLEIPEHFGNCVWCWKKSLKKLLTIARSNPEYFEFPERMEKEYGALITNENVGLFRVFFRERRSTKDILEMSKEDFEKFVDINFEECAEECGSVL